MDAILKNLTQISKAPNVGEKIERNQMLLVALSTTMMLAKNKPLPKEHYQWTRVFLNGIRDEHGRRIENLVGLVDAIDKFEQEQNIEDELIAATVPNEPETPEILNGSSSDDESIEEIPDQVARSTVNIPEGDRSNMEADPNEPLLINQNQPPTDQPVAKLNQTAPVTNTAVGSKTNLNASMP